MCIITTAVWTIASHTNNGLGIRPLVCLKSDVRLEKNDDGSYTIVEPPKNNNIEPTDYGAEVKGYESEYSDVVGWQIFYADTENTYLIADDYIPYENIPTNSAGNKPGKSSSDGPREANLGLVSTDYTGSASITDPEIQALNNEYFTKGYSSTSPNMKAVAYLLDTNAWSVYAGDRAEYAVGGPSIEMLMASYSEKYGVDYRTRAGNLGYAISNDKGSSWKSDISEMLNINDRTYVINSTSDANSYWIASPVAAMATLPYFLFYVNQDGDVGWDYYSESRGFRPLVCLKSDTKLVKNEDGSFTIANN